MALIAPKRASAFSTLEFYVSSITIVLRMSGKRDASRDLFCISVRHSIFESIVRMYFNLIGNSGIRQYVNASNVSKVDVTLSEREKNLCFSLLNKYSRKQNYFSLSIYAMN